LGSRAARAREATTLQALQEEALGSEERHDVDVDEGDKDGDNDDDD